MPNEITRAEVRVIMVTALLDCMATIDQVLQPPDSRSGFGSRAELLAVTLAVAENLLEDNQRSVLKIARRLGMDRMTVKRRLDDLEAIGMIHYVEGKPVLDPEVANAPAAMAATATLEEIFRATCAMLDAARQVVAGSRGAQNE